jgi:hypothetical protein
MVDAINSIYLASSVLAACASLSSRLRVAACSWLVLSTGLLILGLLRMDQAGVWADDYLRRMLDMLGWYAYRRPLQVSCIAVVTLGLITGLKWLPAKGTRVPLTSAICAFCGLAVFAAVRSSSLHWSDEVLGELVGPLTLSHFVQIVLLIATSAAALFDLCSTTELKRNARALTEE